jgi:outer membrane protein
LIILPDQIFKYMKNILTTIMGAVLISVSITSFSQTTLKIGHVDIAQLLAAMPERDSAAVVLSRETKEMQNTYDDMTAVYNKMLDDYEKNQANLTEIVKKNKEAELLDKEKRLGEFEQTATESLQKRNSDLIQPILDKILKAVDKVAGENGFTYVLDVSKGSVVFTSKDSQNINPLVLKELISAAVRK